MYQVNVTRKRGRKKQTKTKTSGRIIDILAKITLAAEIETPENLSGLTLNLGNVGITV